MSCWIIENCICPEPPLVPVCWVFTECCCEPIPEPKPNIRSIPQIDKEFYRIANSKCDIEANIRFGTAYYEQVKKLKFGIEVACKIDLEKVWIKKTLSDLSMLSDPGICNASITTPVVVDTCVYPTPVIVTCPSVTQLSVTASYIT